MFSLCNNFCLYTGCWIVVILFFSCCWRWCWCWCWWSQPGNGSQKDGSAGCWPAFTVFILLLLDNTRCSLQNLPSFKIANDTWGSLCLTKPSRFSILHDNIYCSVKIPHKSGKTTAIPEIPKIFNILFRPKLPFIRSQNWQYSLLWKTRFPGAEEYFYYHPTFLATIYRNACSPYILLKRPRRQGKRKYLPISISANIRMWKWFFS